MLEFPMTTPRGGTVSHPRAHHRSMAPDTNAPPSATRLPTPSRSASDDDDTPGPDDRRTRRPCDASRPARGEVVGWWECPMCARQVAHVYRPGRQRVYCSNACRQKAYRWRRAHGASTRATALRPAERTITFDRRHARRDHSDRLLRNRRDARRRVVTACGTFAVSARERAVTHTDFLPDHPWSCATCVALVHAGRRTCPDEAPRTAQLPATAVTSSRRSSRSPTPVSTGAGSSTEATRACTVGSASAFSPA